jgi:hypothetical protein
VGNWTSKKQAEVTTKWVKGIPKWRGDVGGRMRFFADSEQLESQIVDALKPPGNVLSRFALSP